jgi:RNA polymerase sigma-70 factor (family 1)
LLIVKRLSSPANIPELQRRIALYEDMKAYKELYELLYSGLHRFSYSIVRSKEAAEEIVSDVFIKIWQIRDRLPEIGNLRVYLYTITKNFSLNYIQRNYKNSPVSMDDMDIELVIEIGTPEDLCISAEMIQKIRLAIRQLPPQCRIIFQLIKEDGMRYKEVAEVLNISVFTVRNQLAIAIKKLAEALPFYHRPIFQSNNFSAS